MLRKAVRFTRSLNSVMCRLSCWSQSGDVAAESLRTMEFRGLLVEIPVMGPKLCITKSAK